METLNKKKLENIIITLNILLAVIIVTALSITTLFLHFAAKKEMSTVANIFNLTEFDFFWYSPFIFGGFAFLFIISIAIVLALKSYMENKINSIYFEEGKELIFNEDGISFIISKDNNWTYKDSKFIKDNISINISNCKKAKQKSNNKN